MFDYSINIYNLQEELTKYDLSTFPDKIDLLTLFIKIFKNEVSEEYKEFDDFKQKKEEISEIEAIQRIY